MKRTMLLLFLAVVFSNCCRTANQESIKCTCKDQEKSIKTNFVYLEDRQVSYISNEAFFQPQNSMDENAAYLKKFADNCLQGKSKQYIQKVLNVPTNPSPRRSYQIYLEEECIDCIYNDNCDKTRAGKSGCSYRKLFVYFSGNGEKLATTENGEVTIKGTSLTLVFE